VTQPPPPEPHGYPAPPYPPAQYGPPQYGPPQQPPAPQQGRTSYLVALGAAAVWAAVNIVLVLAVNMGGRGLPFSGYALGLVIGRAVVPTLLASLIVWLIRRRRDSSFVLLMFLALPFYFIVSFMAFAGGAR
jgi:hypothetical protein